MGRRKLGGEEKTRWEGKTRLGRENEVGKEKLGGEEKTRWDGVTRWGGQKHHILKTHLGSPSVG